MDERIAQLKALKKAYRKKRHRATRLGRVFTFLGLIPCLAAVGMWLYVAFYKSPVIRFIDLQLWEPLKELLGITYNFTPVGRFVKCWALPGGAVLLILAVLGICLWRRGVNRTLRTPEYLDYRTLKTTLQAEQEER